MKATEEKKINGVKKRREEKRMKKKNKTKKEQSWEEKIRRCRRGKEKERDRKQR